MVQTKGLTIPTTEDRKVETESLTAGIYYLKCCIEYISDFHRSAKQAAKKDAGDWLTLLNRTLNLIYRSLTEESRERFKKEIAFGDVFYFPEMSQLLLQMTPEQRDMMETMAKAMLDGERIEFTQTDEP
jgi:hypothetical protein